MKKIGYLIAVGMIVGVLGLSFKAEAGGKELEAQKRNKFADDSVVSVQESMERQQEEESAFRKELLESNREIVELLKDIKVLLKEKKETAQETAATPSQQ